MFFAVVTNLGVLCNVVGELDPGVAANTTAVPRMAIPADRLDRLSLVMSPLSKAIFVARGLYPGSAHLATLAVC